MKEIRWIVDNGIKFIYKKTRWTYWYYNRYTSWGTSIQSEVWRWFYICKKIYFENIWFLKWKLIIKLSNITEDWKFTFIVCPKWYCFNEYFKIKLDFTESFEKYLFDRIKKEKFNIINFYSKKKESVCLKIENWVLVPFNKTEQDKQLYSIVSWDFSYYYKWSELCVWECINGISNPEWLVFDSFYKQA